MVRLWASGPLKHLGASFIFYVRSKLALESFTRGRKSTIRSSLTPKTVSLARYRSSLGNICVVTGLEPSAVICSKNHYRPRACRYSVMLETNRVMTMHRTHWISVQKLSVTHLLGYHSIIAIVVVLESPPQIISLWSFGIFEIVSGACGCLSFINYCLQFPCCLPCG